MSYILTFIGGFVAGVATLVTLAALTVASDEDDFMEEHEL